MRSVKRQTTELMDHILMRMKSGDTTIQQQAPVLYRVFSPTGTAERSVMLDRHTAILSFPANEDKISALYQHFCQNGVSGSMFSGTRLMHIDALDLVMMTKDAPHRLAALKMYLGLGKSFRLPADSYTPYAVNICALERTEISPSKGYVYYTSAGGEQSRYRLDRTFIDLLMHLQTLYLSKTNTLGRMKSFFRSFEYDKHHRDSVHNSIERIMS